jgi:hypothetical protein
MKTIKFSLHIIYIYIYYSVLHFKIFNLHKRYTLILAQIITCESLSIGTHLIHDGGGPQKMLDLSLNTHLIVYSLV